MFTRNHGPDGRYGFGERMMHSGEWVATATAAPDAAAAAAAGCSSTATSAC